MVDEIVSQANGDRTKIAQQLQGLAMPVDENGKRYQGPAEAAFNGKAAMVRQQ